MSENKNNDYSDFVKEIENFKKEQNKQKQRGLNDYNVMKVLRKPHAEVGMHSNFIYSLLDIEGDHYQGDLFAKLFVEHALLYEDFGQIKKVQMEEDADGRRIDFTIKSDKYYIGIEMKIYAEDQPNQIADYFNDLTKKTNKNNNQKVEIFYLTLDGKEASKNSCHDISYKRISFEKHILNWLDKCQYEVRNITNLNNAIGYYKEIINILLHKYESPINNFKDFFMKQNNYELFLKFKDELKNKFSYYKEIKNGFEEATQNLYDDFYKLLTQPLIENYHNIKFCKYDYSTKEKCIQFVYNEYYIISIYNNFKTIGIGANWNFLSWQGNEELKQKLYDCNDLIIKYLPEYKISKKKGIKLKSNVFLEPSTTDLFLTKDNKINPLDQNLVNEIRKHIDIIKDALNDPI